jgi:hypothetical protein
MTDLKAPSQMANSKVSDFLNIDLIKR